MEIAMSHVQKATYVRQQMHVSARTHMLHLARTQSQWSNPINFYPVLANTFASDAAFHATDMLGRDVYMHIHYLFQ